VPQESVDLAAARGPHVGSILSDTDALRRADGGAYSDNQPDYTWLQPFDVKSFSMNWYPFAKSKAEEGQPRGGGESGCR